MLQLTLNPGLTLTGFRTTRPSELILIHSADAFVLVTACVDCARVQLKTLFTITAEIHAHSLANFYCQYADRHMNSTICYPKKQIDVSF